MEPWHEWVQRVTRVALEEMEKAHVEDWATAARRCIWTLAGHMSRRHDGRWSAQMLEWTPQGDGRSVGKPLKRWSDDIVRVTEARAPEEVTGQLGPNAWRVLAEDREAWKSLGEDWLRLVQQEEDSSRNRRCSKKE